MTQFETTGDYGQPSVRNITYKSTKGLKAQRKYMDSKFKSQGPMKYGTFALSKSQYKKTKKLQKAVNFSGGTGYNVSPAKGARLTRSEVRQRKAQIDRQKERKQPGGRDRQRQRDRREGRRARAVAGAGAPRPPPVARRRPAPSTAIVRRRRSTPTKEHSAARTPSAAMSKRSSLASAARGTGRSAGGRPGAARSRR